MTDAELEAGFPHVPWRAPLITPVSIEEAEGTLFICRYCAARGGVPPTILKVKTRAMIREGDEDDEGNFRDGGEVESFGPFLWSSSEHQEHLDNEHPLAGAM